MGIPEKLLSFQPNMSRVTRFLLRSNTNVFNTKPFTRPNGAHFPFGSPGTLKRSMSSATRCLMQSNRHLYKIQPFTRPCGARFYSTWRTMNGNQLWNPKMFLEGAERDHLSTRMARHEKPILKRKVKRGILEGVEITQHPKSGKVTVNVNIWIGGAERDNMIDRMRRHGVNVSQSEKFT